MDKTVVVVASHLQKHEKLHAYIRRRHKHYCHDEHNECRTGDIVQFTPANRRISKSKSFIVTKILKQFRAGIDPILPVELQPPTIIPERALEPQQYFPQDIYRDNLTGINSPYINSNIKLASLFTDTKIPRRPKFSSYKSLNSLNDKAILDAAELEHNSKYPTASINKCDNFINTEPPEV